MPDYIEGLGPAYRTAFTLYLRGWRYTDAEELEETFGFADVDSICDALRYVELADQWPAILRAMDAEKREFAAEWLQGSTREEFLRFYLQDDPAFRLRLEQDFPAILAMID